MKVEANAKINLTLRVTGRRNDGFHVLESIVRPIALCDVLEFTPADRFSTDTGYADDLILKAADALSGHLHVTRLQPYAISVTKRIPVGGGMGGGSADAAVALLTLNELWSCHLSPEQLAEIGAAVGSDVPALVLANHYRRSVLMQGRGERVSLLADLPPAIYILLNPRVHSSTPAVYAQFDRMASDPEVRAAKNQLEPPARLLYPEISFAIETLRAAGADDVMMTGSGSTVFGTADTVSRAEAIADSIRSTARYDVFVVKSL